MGDVTRATRRVSKSSEALSEESGSGAKRVHELRVAIRRAGVGLWVVRDCCERRQWKRLRKALRGVRQGAGLLRDCDIHSQLVGAFHLHAGQGRMPEVAALLGRISRDRAEASKQLRELLSAFTPAEWRRLTRRVLRSMSGAVGPCSGRTLHALAESQLPLLIQESRACAAQDIRVPEHLHALRLSLKRLRYAAEVFLPCLPASFRTTTYARLEEAQRRFGEVNDVSTLVDRIDRLIGESDQNCGGDAEDGLKDLRARFASVRTRRCERVAEWWQTMDSEELFTAIETACRATGSSGEGAEHNGEPLMVQNSYTNGTPRVEVEEPHAPEVSQGQRSLWLSGRRLAVIDIGSNSIRLLAVELIDEASWRALAEERAMTRLAQGLGKSGVLSAEAMARSVEAVGRFKSIAEKLGVRNIRAYATAAVREAENRADFLSLIQDRTGLKLELVSELDEGKLTHRSVARVYDLSTGTGAVVDIGGGSLEVVDSQGGVITGNSSMPLGAVRVTEAFGGADECSGKRYKQMCQHIRSLIKQNVRRPDVPPSIMVGCGGTFTTLLTLGAATRGVMIERNSPALTTLGPVARPQLRSLIRDLRGMTLEERLRVPGLPSDRADIVVAGLTVVDELMRHLGATQIFAHPGGVREGLILKLIDEEIAERSKAGATQPAGGELLRSAREFASRCRYERAHSEHVAGLALSLYDQFRDESNLIPALGTVANERVILEAAAVLHDVGMMVEYQSHHKHGFTIIRHADLAGWTSRQLELVALVARYHRRAEPKAKHAEFAALSEADRSLVRRLAGILRVADGLDRSHTQGVEGVRVRFGNQSVGLELRLAGGDATTDIQAAQKKGGLLACLLGVELDIGPAPIRQDARPPEGDVEQRWALGAS